MPAQATSAAGTLCERQTVLHSWCIQTQWNAPTVVGGEGARLHTADGRTILDMSSLAECSSLGHQHPRVVAAIRAQAQKLCFFVTSAWGAEPRAELAALLLERSGFTGGRVFFTLGGTDANEHAVKFARAAAARPRGWVITRERSYQGASYAAMALSGDTRTAAQVDAAGFGVVHVPPPYAYRCPFGTVSAEECAAGVAALESYRDEGLIERSRALGAQMLGALKRMQARHAVIGDVRGGHGLFAVVELVRDRSSRTPLAPWPQMHAALRRLLESALGAGVSFAARGNLLLLAPPLVIGERELGEALELLDRLLGELGACVCGERSS